MAKRCVIDGLRYGTVRWMAMTNSYVVNSNQDNCSGLAPATASATASTLHASADGAPVTSGSRLSDMAPCLVVEETDPLQIYNLTAGSRGNLPEDTGQVFFTTSKRNGGKLLYLLKLIKLGNKFKGKFSYRQNIRIPQKFTLACTEESKK